MMKARSTLHRELTELRGMRSRAGLADGDKWRLGAMIQVLRWALNSENQEWSRPRECLHTAARTRRELF